VERITFAGLFVKMNALAGDRSTEHRGNRLIYRIMNEQTFCQICRHPSPGHEPNCPVLIQDVAAAEQQQMLQNQLGQSAMGFGALGYDIEFIGGPLDGPNRVHPAMNYKCNVEGHPEGYYEMMLFDGKFHWITRSEK
jgi:hypothetical protein